MFDIGKDVFSWLFWTQKINLWTQKTMVFSSFVSRLFRKVVLEQDFQVDFWKNRKSVDENHYF